MSQSEVSKVPKTVLSSSTRVPRKTRAARRFSGKQSLKSWRFGPDIPSESALAKAVWREVFEAELRRPPLPPQRVALKGAAGAAQ